MRIMFVRAFVIATALGGGVAFARHLQIDMPLGGCYRHRALFSFSRDTRTLNNGDLTR